MFSSKTFYFVLKDQQEQTSVLEQQLNPFVSFLEAVFSESEAVSFHHKMLVQSYWKLFILSQRTFLVWRCCQNVLDNQLKSHHSLRKINCCRWKAKQGSEALFFKSKQIKIYFTMFLRPVLTERYITCCYFLLWLFSISRRQQH